VRGGFALVPTFDERLRYYETHRDQFATLADFLPQLMDGAGKASAKAAADGPEKTTAGQCGIQVAVAAPALPAGASTGQ
jgi:hypothetical protein